VVKVAIGEGGAILDANPAELARARAHGGETARSKFVARFVRSIVQSWLGGDFAPSADGEPSNGFRCLVLTAVIKAPAERAGDYNGPRRRDRERRLPPPPGTVAAKGRRGLLSSVGHRPFTVVALIGQVEGRESGARGRGLNNLEVIPDRAVETAEEAVSWKKTWRDLPRGRTSPVWKKTGRDLPRGQISLGHSG
jgi:hypothetical protein